MPYGQSALFRHLDAFNESQASAMNRSTTVSSTTSRPSVGTVLSGQAISSVLADQHKAAGLVVGSPMRLFTGFHEEDALVSAQSPNVGESRDVSSSPVPVGSLFVRRDAWKRLKIPENIRSSTIERSTAALSEMSGRSDPSVFLPASSQAGKVSVSGDTAAAETTNTASSTAPRVQFLDATSLTPLPTRNANQVPHTACAALSNLPKFNLFYIWGLYNLSYFYANCHGHEACSLSLHLVALLIDVELLAEADNVSSDDDERARRPGGIKLTKSGYYIFPTVEELSELVDEDGRCVVQNFIIGRQSYGHILFPGLTDITGIDFNDVVHIRRREVVVYPDDSTKPPVGYGLNRKAEVTLDGIWPADKSTREFIKSPQRLAAMHFDERLEKATQKMNATFIEYRPDTGSWVFEVKHFSKYRLEDSDEESSDQTQAFLPANENNKTRGLSLPLQHNGIAGSTTPRTYVSSFDNLESSSCTDTSLWTSQANPSEFCKAKDSLLLRKYGSLGEDILGVQDYDEVLFTAASGGHFMQNLSEDLPDMKKSSQFSTLHSDTLHISYMDNLPITKKSPDSYTKSCVLQSITTITPFRISFRVPASRVESLHGIHNPMANLARSRARKDRLIAVEDDDFALSRFSVPYKEITALLGG
ncbi:unnamed protein product [Dibothriocephalus latus]|uniref:Peptidase S59 domain-containing protein n=1 Tax=Dibothriocephalus latus TaxID=60516 RepID=A0A3P7LF74_DIBLA|nr:unnamed protein product [Dibothriocephalus latus]